MNKVSKRILSLCMAAALALGGLTPQMGMTAYAATSGTEGEAHDGIDFDALVNSGFYYGTYKHLKGDTTTEDEATPVLWRVMGEESDGKLTLLSEYVLAESSFGVDDDQFYGNTIYDTSVIKSFLGKMDLFERFETLAETTDVTTKVHSNMNGAEITGDHFGTSHPVTTAGQTLYLPWGKQHNSTVYWDVESLEVADYSLSDSMDGHKATLKDGTSFRWWLRSPSSNDVVHALYVAIDGSVDIYFAGKPLGVRPAFQINPTSVLFASKIADEAVADNGETQADDENYSATPAVGDANYKLTIVDPKLTLSSLTKQGFEIHTGGSLTIAPGGTLDLGGTITVLTDKLVYKIVEITGDTRDIVGYGTGDKISLTVNGTANVTDGGDLTEGGNYILYVWAQKDDPISSHVGSMPMYFTLEVGEDRTPPTVKSVTPSGTQVPLDTSSLSITFNEDMDTNPDQIGTVVVDNDATLGNGSWQDDNRTIQYDLSGLAYSTEYTIEIRNFQDAAGNSTLEVDSSHAFTTVAEPQLGEHSITVTADPPQGGNPKASPYNAVASTPITLEAHPATGYTFNGWESNDVTLTDKAMQSTTFTMPDNDVKITAHYTPVSTPPSSGGSSKWDSTKVLQPRAVTLAEAMAAYKKALPNAVDSIVTAELSGWFSELPLSVQQALAKQAEQDGVTVKLQISQVPNIVLQAKLTVNPAQAKQTVQLMASCTNPSAVSRATFFKRWFANKLFAVSTGQNTTEDGWVSYGQPVELVVNPELTGMDTKNLVFYSYDQASNTYRRIENPEYWIDKNGNLYFTTELAGDVIVSAGILQ